MSRFCYIFSTRCEAPQIYHNRALTNEFFMTSIKNHKTSLVAISAIATVLVVSTIAMGNGHIAFADENVSVTKNVDNTGINVQTHTNQKQDCQTAGGMSPLAFAFGFHGSPNTPGSCIASSTDKVNQIGGQLTK
jgi:hypothetical protein